MTQGQYMAEQRRKNIALIRSLIARVKERNQDIIRRRFIANIGIETGLTENKIMEYLRMIEDNGEIVITETNILVSNLNEFKNDTNWKNMGEIEEKSRRSRIVLYRQSDNLDKKPDI